MTHQILIIEDDPAIASTLKFTLEREGWQVTWLDTASAVLPTLAQLPTLSAIVMDVGLPDGDGFSLCQQVRFGEHHSHVPILFLTARNDEIDKIIGLEMGADDYITKPFSPREVIARLKAIWRREEMHLTQTHPTPNPPTYEAHHTEPHPKPSTQNFAQDFSKQLPTGSWQYTDHNCQLSWQNTPLVLSKMELTIMLTLLHQPNRILSREQILHQVSDYPEHRLARTIDSHIKTLRQKLAEIDPTCEVIITHRGLGYGLKQ
ncbi:MULTISPECIES: response regulator [unclassified Moraxella]|uniref:response regulator n=1 Tax=unclassified Moraxella TaxID=2685852 RepID=UPI003AF71D63